MSIKIKHSANMISAAVSATESGRAKRLAQGAALAKNTPQQIQVVAGARAGAAPVGHSSAPLTSASPGAGVRTAPLSPFRGGSTARTVSSSFRSSIGGAGNNGDYKVTGTSVFDDPGDGSQWDPSNGGRWIRPWQPGEKEAETRRRVGEVDNELYTERELTSQGQKERAALVGDITKAIKDGKFSQDEIPGLMREFGIAEDQIRMADALRDREPTAREQFMKNTFTDERGIIFSPDGKVLYNPQETELRRLDALRTRADNFEKELRKPRKITSTDENGVPSDNYVERTEEEISAIMQKRFPELYPASQVQEQPPTATPTPQNPVATPDPATDNPGDPLAAFKKYKN